MRLLAGLLLISGGLFAQTSTCQFSFTFTQATGFGSQPSPTTFDNRLKGCNAFTLNYQATGLSAVNVLLESAGGAGTSGTFGTYSGSVAGGANPSTSTTGTQALFTGYVGWLRVTVTGTPSSGTWRIIGTVYGAQTGGAGSSTGAVCAASGTGACFVQGAGADGAATVGNPVLIGGTDGTNTQSLSTDTSGQAIPSNKSSSLGGDFSATELTPTGAGAALLFHQVLPYVYNGSNLTGLRGNNTGITLSNQNSGPNDTTSNNSSGPTDSGGANQFFFRTFPMLYDGNTQWQRNRGMTLASTVPASTLTARSVVGSQLIEKNSRWSVTSNPGAGMQATATIAAESNVRHVVDCVMWSAVSGGAVVATSTIITIRDGATGAGTILWQFVIAQITATGAGAQITPPGSVCGLNLTGTTNTAMTAEWSSGGVVTNAAESISFSGFNVINQ